MEGNGVLITLLVVMSAALFILLVVAIGIGIALWRLISSLRRTVESVKDKAAPVLDNLKETTQAVRKTAENIRDTAGSATAAIQAGKAFYDGLGIVKGAGRAVSSARSSGSGLLAGVKAAIAALFTKHEEPQQEGE
jgi:predicted PurR-regulated permease PerM